MSASNFWGRHFFIHTVSISGTGIYGSLIQNGNKWCFTTHNGTQRYKEIPFRLRKHLQDFGLRWGRLLAASVETYRLCTFMMSSGFSRALFNTKSFNYTLTKSFVCYNMELSNDRMEIMEGLENNRVEPQYDEARNL